MDVMLAEASPGGWQRVASIGGSGLGLARNVTGAYITVAGQ
jgi:hypothetical protein